MTVRSKTKGFGVSFAAALAIAGWYPTGSLAAPLAASKPSQLVSLQSGAVACPCDANSTQVTVMQTSNGTTGNLVLATGRAVIVTQAEATGTTVAQNTMEVFLLRFKADCSAGILLASSFGTANPNGFFRAEPWTFPSGVVLNSSTLLCVSGRLAPGGTPATAALTAQGFFTKDK